MSENRVILNELEAKLDAREGYWELVLDVELTMRELIARVREAEAQVEELEHQLSIHSEIHHGD